MREKIEYTPEELARPAKYIIVMCDTNIDTHIIDLEEATAYVNKFKRKVIIISDREVFKDSIETLNYSFVMNATKPTIKLIDNHREQYSKVQEYILSKYKNGLIIAYPETITNDIADKYALTKNMGHDYVIYRNNLLEMTGNERSRVTHMRIHANMNFEFSKGFFETVKEKFGERNTLGIFLAHFISHYQLQACRHYIKEHTDKFESQGMQDYVNYREMNRQMAYYVYYDMEKAKVLNFTKEKLKEYLIMLMKSIQYRANQDLIDKLSIIYSNEQ